VQGDESLIVHSIAPLEEATGEDLTFADDRHASGLSGTKAAAAIVAHSARVDAASLALVRVDDVAGAMLALLTSLAGPEELPPPGIHPSATVAPDARIGSGVTIAAGAVVAAGAAVGDGSVLCANVSLGPGCVVGAGSVLFEGVVVRAASRIGDRARIGPNSVIGYEGFGYHTVGGVHRHVPHMGNVVIEDDVEIGACTCVDRAKFGSTVIARGAKVDNLVQIAHNCRVGSGSILTGQVGLAGSVKLGRYVVIGGHAGLRDNIEVGDGAQIAAYAGVAEDIPAGGRVAGAPARPAREALRIWQSWARLPDLLQRVKKLESRLEALESAEDH
jgi:UDP-3-O-[3-hydroxymyristoyl] glucosamine N-acyltransferase